MNSRKNLLFISYFLEYGLAIGIIRQWQISTHQMGEILISWDHLVAIMTADVAFRSWNALPWKSTEATAQMIALDNGQPGCLTTHYVAYSPEDALTRVCHECPALPGSLATWTTHNRTHPHYFQLNRKSALGAAHSPDEETFSWSRTGFQGDGRSCYHRCQSCSAWLLFQFSHFWALWSDEELIAHIFVDCVEAVLCCLVEVALCWWSCIVLLKLCCCSSCAVLLKLCCVDKVVLKSCLLAMLKPRLAGNVLES